MKKSFLIGLGVTVSAAFIASKKLTENQKDRIAMKIDETLINIRDMAVKYERYAKEYLSENHDTIDNIKKNVFNKISNIKNDKESSDIHGAFESLKNSTDQMSDYIDNDSDSSMQDDIFIDNTNDNLDNDLKVETFYPEGWNEDIDNSVND